MTVVGSVAGSGRRQLLVGSNQGRVAAGHNWPSRSVQRTRVCRSRSRRSPEEPRLCPGSGARTISGGGALFLACVVAVVTGWRRGLATSGGEDRRRLWIVQGTAETITDVKSAASYGRERVLISNGCAGVAAARIGWGGSPQVPLGCGGTMLAVQSSIDESADMHETCKNMYVVVLHLCTDYAVRIHMSIAPAALY